MKNEENFLKHIFCLPDSSCGRVPIKNLIKKGGTMVASPRIIIADSRDHQGDVMGSLYSSELASDDSCEKIEKNIYFIQVSL